MSSKKEKYLYSVDMLKKIILLSFLVGVTSIWAQSSEGAIYDFRSVPDQTSPTIVADADVQDSGDTKADLEVDSPSSEEELVQDVQASIKEKLIEKYKVRLDKVISSIADKISLLSAEQQRVVLWRVQDTIAQKKALVLWLDINELQKDITLSLLDHIYYRIDGLLQQAAQSPHQDTSAV